jgi:hypothetical protein
VRGQRVWVVHHLGSVPGMIEWLFQYALPLVAFGVCWWPCCGTTYDPCVSGTCLACQTGGVASHPSFIDVTFPTLSNGACTCTAYSGATIRVPFGNPAGSCDDSSTGTCFHNVFYLKNNHTTCGAANIDVAVICGWGNTARVLTVNITRDNGSGQNRWQSFESGLFAPWDCNAFASQAVPFGSTPGVPPCSGTGDVLLTGIP